MTLLLRIVCWLAAALMWWVPASFASAAMASNVSDSSDAAVVEHLRVKVPVEARAIWLEAEQGSWEPWLAQQDGFLGRDLLWDATTEEGTLLIRWKSRAQWKAIPQADVNKVQDQFERLAREGTGLASGNPFPLVFEGELLPQ